MRVDFGGLALFGLLFSFFVVWIWCDSKNRRNRILAKLVQVSIGTVNDGEIVKLIGCVAIDRELLTAPLSGRPCVCYEVTVEEERYGSEGGSYWSEVIREQVTRDFLLRDGSGVALVALGREPRNARHVVLCADYHYSSNEDNDATPTLKAFLTRHREESIGWFSKRSLRYHEAVIEVGATAIVVGQASREHDPSPSASSRVEGYRDAPSCLVLQHTDSLNLAVSNDPAVVDGRRSLLQRSLTWSEAVAIWVVLGFLALGFAASMFPSLQAIGHFSALSNNRDSSRITADDAANRRPDCGRGR